MLKNEKYFAVCGLECSNCKIFKARDNQEIANELVSYFEGQWENVKMEDFHCNGCRDEVDCWSPDCRIRKCCVYSKKLDYCYECQEFPCEGLNEWAHTSEEYESALDNLKEMKKKGNKST
ncbi:MAG: DUF3795 domain-containing protein [Promethearchaeota archaeon]